MCLSCSALPLPKNACSLIYALREQIACRQLSDEAPRTHRERVHSHAVPHQPRRSQPAVHQFARTGPSLFFFSSLFSFSFGSPRPDDPLNKCLQRIAKITQALCAELSDLLGSVLASRPISAPPPSSNNSTSNATATNSYRQDLLTTLRTFLSLGMVHEAEEIIRSELVQPFVRRTVTRENLGAAKPLPPSPAPASSSTTVTPSAAAGGDEANGPSSTITTTTIPAPYRIERLPLPTQPPPRDGTNLIPLTTLYNRILEFVERECGTVLDVAERVLDPESAVGVGGQGETGGTGSEQRKRSEKKQQSGEEVDGTDEATAATAAATAVADLRLEASADSLGSVKEGGNQGDSEHDRVAGFQVLTNVVVDEIAKAITSELGGVVFAAGRPTVFHQVRSFGSSLLPFSGDDDTSTV